MPGFSRFRPATRRCPSRGFHSSVLSWIEETIRSRVNLHGARLRPATDATTVKVRDGELIITDGPYAETREQVAGYDLLECADLDEAIEVARAHPMARLGILEVRPFWPFED